MEAGEFETSGAQGPRVFVTGSTGELGRRVIGALLRQVPPHRIVAGVRSPDHDVARQFVAQGIEVRVADYAKPESLAEAFGGIDRLLMISSSANEGRLAHHRNVIRAAMAAKVGLLAYTSLLHADSSSLRFGEDHRLTEEILAESGLPHVLLRHGWYLENHLQLIAPALKFGALLGCAGAGRFSTAMRDDFAAAAAAVLTAEAQAGRIYELAGDQSYTLSEFAAEIAAAAGKAVVCRDMPEIDFRRTLVEMKLPEAVAALVADADTGASRGDLENNGRQLSALIGRPTADWRQVVESAVTSALQKQLLRNEV